MLKTASTPVGIALIAVVLATVPGRAVADLWYEHYTAAEEALAEGDWTEAIDQLNRALEKKGDSGARARTYGMKFIPYFPYLRLGIAYYELGQLDAALQAFETEERLGAIAAAPERDELERYRELTLAAKRQAADREAERIRGVVSRGLADADRLEREGRVEEAIAALGQALAVAPDDEAALTALARLRGELAEQQRQADLRSRVEQLVSEGRRLLAADRLAEAASVLRQALALDDDPDARALLDTAQERLRAALAAPADERAAAVTRGLREATELAEAGRLEEALERLQPILVLDPEQGEAQALERALLDQQAEAEQARLRDEAIAGFLAEAASALAGGRFEQAMGAANRVLALDAGNRSALDHLGAANRAVSRRLLGGPSRQNFPPAIRFADQREELGDGILAQVVRQPGFRLTGVVIDDSPVTVEISDSGRGEIAATATPQSLGDLFVTEFHLAHSLRAGLTTLRLVATDAEGSTSSAEYVVLYAPPWRRRPAFWAALVALLGLAGAIAVAIRRRRRRRLRGRRFNPYVAGAPVLDDKLFFGREQLIDRILQTLHNNSLLLHGERRIGKTTLQHQLKRRLEALEDPAYDFFPVYIDLQGTPEEQFFATLGEGIFEELEPVLDGLEPHAPLGGPYGYRELVADLRSILKHLHRRSDKQVRLVLLIDEVDELNAYDPKVNQKLRSLFMKSFAEDLVAVVSGVSIKREWEREGSPWYNFFEEIDVGPFHPDHARELVEQPIRGVLKLQDGVVERIVELTGGRPYRIQKLCMQLVSRAYEAGRRDIAVADVEAIGDLGSRGQA